MAIVRNPLCSIWASGTIGKTLTCRALGGPRFSMAKYISQRKRRTPSQIQSQQNFKRKILLMQRVQEMAKAHSGVSGLMGSGIGASNASYPHVIALRKIPQYPFIKE